MSFSLIATIGKRNELGKNGHLVFQLQCDTALFERLTLNHPVLMGINTFRSLSRVLENRENFVLVRTLSDFFAPNMIATNREKGIDPPELRDPDFQSKVLQGDSAALKTLIDQLPKNLHLLTNLDGFILNLPDDVEVFVIGGGSVYAQMISRCDKLYLTEVDATDDEADVYFPNFLHHKYNRQLLDEGDENGAHYQHFLYERKTNGN